jgi:signal transduction histidine kinase
LYSRFRLSPALHWHLHLLGELLGAFYIAKLREEQLRHQSYLQAVHETGARLTHDIKNLLQSLNVLCLVASDESTRDSPDVTALLGRQLPAIAQRLSATLEKLQRPLGAGETYIPADAWWDALARQYRSEGVEFAPTSLPQGARLPRSLFDSVADNFIRNALAKRAAEGRVHVQIALQWGSQIALRVCDSGTAVPADIEKNLFRAPVPSRAGLGIGLYQAARQAESSGYGVALESNRDGEVCFTLKGPAS